MGKIIETGDRIILHTAMTDREFAKANMMQHMKAEGYIAKEAEGGSFEFSKWFFEDTAANEDGEFELLGEGLEGVTAYQILKEVEEACKDTEICTKPNQTQLDAWSKIFRIIKAMREAEKQKLMLPNCGAVGIIYADDGRILFLPELLVTRSIAMRSQSEAAEYTESWRQSILPIEQMPSFSAAVMIYTIITGHRPYNSDSPEQLADDFLDSYFVPAEYICPLSKDNAEILDTALKGKIKFRPTLKRLLSIFGEDISGVYQAESKTAQKEIKDKAYSKISKRIGRSRFFRKHFAQIAAVFIAVILVTAGILSIVNTEMSRPTTKGQTAFQVVESFYSSLNHLETVRLEECISKAAGKEIKGIVTNLYVTSKMQSAYNSGQGIMTPAQWIIKANPERTSVYGITRLKINGIESNTSADWFQNVQALPLNIENGTNEHFDAEYYLVYTDNPETITIVAYKDSLELTFIKDRWLITKFERNETPSECDKAQFFKDLSENKTGSYAWFPTEKELEAGKAELAPQPVLF